MNTERPFFSIIIPVYNRAAMLSKVIDHVVAQSFRSWEAIIVDDGSTDNTREVAAGFSDSRIRYIFQENAERGAARNNGIRNASGTYISFIDSDDYILPLHLQTAHERLTTEFAGKIIHQNYRMEQLDGSLFQRVRKLPPHLNQLLKAENPISCNGIFIPADIASQNLFDENRTLAGTEDYELWLRLAAHYDVFHFDEVTSVIVQHPERSMSSSQWLPTEHRIKYFLDKVLDNPDVVNFLGHRRNQFIAGRFRYLSLIAALTGHRTAAVKYYTEMIKLYPYAAFSIRNIRLLARITTTRKSAGFY